MNAQPLLTRLKRQLKRATSLLMLFQRGGATAQALVPELNLAASAGALEAAKAVVATAVGLGAYDSVAGATSVVQTAPRQDSKLVFVVGSSTSAGLAISGTSHGAPTWTMSPSVSGLTLTGNWQTATLSGTATAQTKTAVTITARDGARYSTNGSFTVIAAAKPSISAQPQSQSIASGETARLSVTASAAGAVSYRWYEVQPNNSENLIATATSSTYTTPTLSTNKRYRVKVIYTYETIEFITDSDIATVTVQAPPLSITSAATATAGTVNAAYSYDFSASGGTTPYSWSQPAGVLPSGLTLNSSGALNGTPSSAGIYSFTVRVTDNASATANQTVSLTINPIISTNAALPLAKGDQPYSQTLQTSGTSGSLYWDLGAGSSLPQGLSLNSSSGLLSGTPTQPGNYSFVVNVETSTTPPLMASKTFTLSVLGLSTAADLGSTLRGHAFSADLEAAGGSAPYGYATAPGSSLPAGLSLNPNTGLISGTVSAAANTYNFTVQITDAASQTASRDFSLVVVEPNLVIRDEDNQMLSLEDSLYFGGTSPGQSLLRTLTLTNQGSTAIALSNLSTSSEFLISGLPASLDPAASATVTLEFKPALYPGIFRRQDWVLSTDDSATPQYLFHLSGQCHNQAPLTQTLSIVGPSTLYIGQSPVKIHAYSSAGLPVLLERSEGTAANLSGNAADGYLLTPGAAAGLVTLRASQAGDIRFNSAKYVFLKVNVIAATKPTLINLTHLYDGSSKSAEVVGLSVGGNATLTYSAGGAPMPSVSEPGTYPVIATLGGTDAGKPNLKGSLVIKQAPLWVVANPKQRRVMKDNPPFDYALHNALGNQVEMADAQWTTAPVASCKANPLSPAGNYPITLSKGVSRFYLPIAVPATLTVEGFGSNHEALIFDSAEPHHPLGLIKIACTSIKNTGSLAAPALRLSFTASLISHLNPSTTALSFAGGLELDGSGDFVSATASAPTPGALHLKSLTLRRSGRIEGVIAKGAAEHAFSGLRLLEANAGTITHAGQHTLLLEPGVMASDGSTPSGNDAPGGFGYGNASVDRNGGMKISGTLGDGSSFTASLAADISADPGYRLFVQHHKRVDSSLAGQFSMTLSPNLAALPPLQGRRLARSTVTLRKSANAADSSYVNGYGPLHCALSIDPWLTPNLTTLPLRLLMGISPENPNPLVFLHHNLTSGASADLFDRAIKLDSATNRFAPLDDIGLTWRLTYAPATGIFSGSVTQGLFTNTFKGVLRLPASPLDTNIGAGQFSRANSPIQGKSNTGGIQLIRPIQIE